MATQAKIRMMPSGRQGGGAAMVTVAPQKTSATFEVGDPVKLSAGTLVAASTTASLGTSSNLTAPAAASANLILGISGIDAASGNTTSTVVHRMAPGARFIGNLVHGTASSAKATAANLGSVVYIAKQTASDVAYGFTLDTAGSFGATFINGRITQLIDAASTVNGRVEVEFTGGGTYLGTI